MKISLEKYDLKEIQDAYRKLKSYVYYDNYSLYLRSQLADFEGDGDIDKKLQNLTDKLNDYIKNNELPDFIDKINYWILPKEFKSPSNTEEETILSNVDFDDNIFVKRQNYFINAPIEIHILVVLWIIKIGYHLEKLLIYKPFGNKLELNKDNQIVSGIRLFCPYYIKYQDWRDKALAKAKELVSKKKSALILGLDIKEYFYSVRFDFKEIDNSLKSIDVKNTYKSLTKLLEKIHKFYTNLIILENQGSDEKCLLPIGLLSSGLISNWYLRHFDHEVISRLNPEYYGRYVDDILIVISNPDKQNARTAINLYEKYFKSNGLLELDETDNKKTDFFILPEYYPLKNLQIQKRKFSVFYIDQNEPKGMLDKFAEEIQKNRSEFRFLPDEQIIKSEFDNSAFSLTFSGSKLRLRSITAFNEDKFGISKFLAKKIFLSLHSDEKSNFSSNDQIIKFFKGRRTIEYRDLWEKCLTYFLINNQKIGYFKVVEEALKAIKKLGASSSVSKARLIESLFELLEISIELSLSLNPGLIKNKNDKGVHRLKIKYNFDLISRNFLKKIYNFRASNLLRHNYVAFPLVNYSTKVYDSKISLNLIDKDMKRFYETYAPFEIDIKLSKYSPRFVHFHEIAINHFYNDLYRNTEFKYYDNRMLYLDTSFADYFKINYSRDFENKKEVDFKNVLFKSDEEVPAEENKQVHIKRLSLDQDEIKRKLNIALANMEIRDEVISQKYLHRPYVSGERQYRYNQLFNALIQDNNNVDLFVLPEISIPHKILPKIAKFSQQKAKAIIFGLEHLIIRKTAFNFVVVLLPVHYKGFIELIPIIRLKNHYSPEEKRVLKGYGYKIPKSKPYQYSLINWRNIQFTVFNCYELADISHRVLFKSLVDFLVASEFNKDINYFSSIVESTARELHCFFIQSNNAKYGDSRITSPSKTEVRDIMKIKGGKNYTILVDEININKLREFQLLNYELQKDSKYNPLGFKPTPPDFNKDKVLKRIKEH